jgi:hypothetical protein
MSEADDLVEWHRRENRRWKALALAACVVVALMSIAWYVGASQSRRQMGRLQAEEQRALAEAHRAFIAAKSSPAQPAPRPDAAP